MENRGSLLAAMTAGAGLTYLLDPAGGARRRARARDAVVRASGLTRRVVRTTARDAVQRTYGTAAALGGLLRRDAVDDTVLAERVRARLGRYVSHPHAIDISARDGAVTVSGPILTAEADSLLHAVRRVRGVCEVADSLDRHDEPGTIPALQGGRVPPGERLDVLQHHWSPTTRCMAWTAGATLVAFGAAQWDLTGTAALVAGTSLIARATANVPLSEILGLGRGDGEHV